MTKSLCETLVRPDVLAMQAYQSARRELFIENSTWLNANESGGNDQLTITLENLNRYPDFQPSAVVNGYASYAGVPVDNVLASRGADEGIEILIRAFCESGKDSIVICPPTYGMYAVSATSHNAQCTKVPLNASLQLDLDGLAKQKGKCKLVFICSPNNPTGHVINREDIIATLNLFKDSALVVVDEAYIEFCPENTVANLLSEYPNLVILRTLSKAFAFAGLRCGFTLASSEIIAMMSKIIAPYPLSQPVAEIAAKALMPEGLTIMRRRVARSNTLKHKVEEFLDKQPWLEKRFDSQANFILFKCEQSSALFSFLMEQGVLIRDQSKQPTLENCLRVSIGNGYEINEFYKAVNLYNETIYNENGYNESDYDENSQKIGTANAS